MKKSSDRPAWVFLAIVVALAALFSLAAHAYLGTFGRYIADDFCTASTLRRLGFLESQSYWYQTWTGRYAYTFAISLMQAIGPGLTPWLPLLALLGWGAAIAYAARHLQGPRGAWLLAAAVAAIHIFGTLRGSPSVYQSLYWQTGMVTYTLPLILGTAYLAWLWQAAAREGGPRHNLPAAAISMGSAFLLGGFSETYVVLQTVALALLLAAVPLAVVRPQRARAALVVGSGLLGSIIAALTVALAPGTQVRRSLMPATPDLVAWIEATLRDGYLFLARTAKGAPEVILLAIMVPLLLVFLHHRQLHTATGPPPKRGDLLLVLLLPAVTPILMLSAIAPYEFAVSSYPDSRVLVTPMFILVSGLALWGGRLGDLLARLPWARAAAVSKGVLAVSAVVVLALLAASARSAVAILQTADESRSYAQSWDTRDEKLRQVPADAELVPAASLRHMGGLAEIGRDPEEWINRCVAGTYGLGSVVAK